MPYMVTFTINIPPMLAYIYHTWILWVFDGGDVNNPSVRLKIRSNILVVQVVGSRLGQQVDFLTLAYSLASIGCSISSGIRLDVIKFEQIYAV